LKACGRRLKFEILNLKLDVSQSEKLIVAITGENGSGKDTVSDLLVSKYGAKKLVFSDLLKEALMVFVEKENIGRSDFSWLSTNLRKRFGDGILGHGMKKKIDATEEKLIVISGVRDFGELKMIQSYAGGILLYVTADIKTRWERLRARNIKADDQVSFEQFSKEKENLPSEKHIRALGIKADYRIDNDGNKEDLEKSVDEFMKKIKVRNSNE